MIRGLMINRDQHPVQIRSARIGEIVGTVERDVQVVLCVGFQDKFRGGPSAKVVGPGEADGAAVCAFLQTSCADAAHHLRRIPHDLEVSVVVFMVRIETGGDRAVDRTVTERLFQRCPPESVGRGPPQHPSPDNRLRSLIGNTFSVLGSNPLARLVSDQLFVGVWIIPRHIAAHRLVALIGRCLWILEKSR